VSEKRNKLWGGSDTRIKIHLQKHILYYNAFIYKALDTKDLKVITKIPLNFLHLMEATFANVLMW
jgi:hypothetical protein